MKILPINQSRYPNKEQQSFGAYMPERFYRCAEKCTFKVERAERRIVNSLRNFIIKLYSKLFKAPKGIGDNKKKLGWLTREEAEYIKWCPELHSRKIYEISKMMCAGKEIEINIENEELQNIVNSGESCIFIMNHDRQKEDPKLFSFFNALLTREYISSSKDGHYPKSKILINKDILDTSNENKRIYADVMGAIGIDSGIHCANKFANGKILMPIVQELIEDKTNLFIFPEGRMSLFMKTSPQWKFQSGIADIIKTVAKRKNQIKVVPLGFAYNNNIGGINIGTPIYFKKSGNNIVFKPGDVEPVLQDKNYTDFIQTSDSVDGWFKITENGDAVPIKDCGEYIAGILCESLTLSKKRAAESIKSAGTPSDTSTLYTIGDEYNE